MGESTRLFRGVFRGGVVVPEAGGELPDGTAVEFGLAEPLPPELLEELKAWERAGDETWAMIDAWERGERDAPG